MPMFVVEKPEVWKVAWEVEAEDAKDAIEKVGRGLGNPLPNDSRTKWLRDVSRKDEDWGAVEVPGRSLPLRPTSRPDRDRETDWEPSTLEDCLIHDYWREVGGIIFLDVPVGGSGDPETWPPGSRPRYIDALRITGTMRTTLCRSGARPRSRRWLKKGLWS